MVQRHEPEGWFLLYVQAKWLVLGCMMAKLPADKGMVFDGSSLSPVPMLKVPVNLDNNVYTPA